MGKCFYALPHNNSVHILHTVRKEQNVLTSPMFLAECLQPLHPHTNMKKQELLCFFYPSTVLI